LDCGWINQQIRVVTATTKNIKQQATVETVNNNGRKYNKHQTGSKLNLATST